VKKSRKLLDDSLDAMQERDRVWDKRKSGPPRSHLMPNCGSRASHDRHILLQTVLLLAKQNLRMLQLLERVRDCINNDSLGDSGVVAELDRLIDEINREKNG
jgi:hypothetical protein